MAGVGGGMRVTYKILSIRQLLRPLLLGSAWWGVSWASG